MDDEVKQASGAKAKWNTARSSNRPAPSLPRKQAQTHTMQRSRHPWLVVKNPFNRANSSGLPKINQMQFLINSGGLGMRTRIVNHPPMEKWLAGESFRRVLASNDSNCRFGEPAH
jgi:hypothetical protein